MFTMKSDVVNRPSVVNDDLVKNVAQIIYERRRFTISHFFMRISTNFTRCSQLHYHTYAWLSSQILSKMGSENAHSCAQNVELASALTF
jgi:hypothetical protein